MEQAGAPAAIATPVADAATGVPNSAFNAVLQPLLLPKLLQPELLVLLQFVIDIPHRFIFSSDPPQGTIATKAFSNKPFQLGRTDLNRPPRPLANPPAALSLARPQNPARQAARRLARHPVR